MGKYDDGKRGSGHRGMIRRLWLAMAWAYGRLISWATPGDAVFIVIVADMDHHRQEVSGIRLGSSNPTAEIAVTLAHIVGELGSDETWTNS